MNWKQVLGAVGMIAVVFACMMGLATWVSGTQDNLAYATARLRATEYRVGEISLDSAVAWYRKLPKSTAESIDESFAEEAEKFDNIPFGDMTPKLLSDKRDFSETYNAYLTIWAAAKEAK